MQEFRVHSVLLIDIVAIVSLCAKHILYQVLFMDFAPLILDKLPQHSDVVELVSQIT